LNVPPFISTGNHNFKINSISRFGGPEEDRWEGA
jgi:hypothetical protein